LAISGATADGIVSLTIALIPSAVIGTAVGNVAIYALNLGFLVAVLGLYAFLNSKRQGQELEPGFVSLFLGLYGAYVVITTWLLAS
jgi:cation:H+ antiporter